MSFCLFVCMHLCVYVCMYICRSLSRSKVGTARAHEKPKHAKVFISTEIAIRAIHLRLNSWFIGSLFLPHAVLYISLFIHPSISPSVCLSAYIYVGMGLCMYVCMHLCMHVALSLSCPKAGTAQAPKKPEEARVFFLSERFSCHSMFTLVVFRSVKLSLSLSLVCAHSRSLDNTFRAGKRLHRNAI